ncbi:MAG TPA: outer membrane lipoprotein carrier protein LolA, partial [Rubrivivax sp.]|nr:outer membrane lipoprotein carrier protein LolA [Rubrivivax sp.]
RAGLALAWATPAGASWAAGFDLAALSAQLARNKSGQARFTEERFVSGFDGPLRASGVLSFVAPDRFTRQTLEPLAETMTMGSRVWARRRR